MFTTETQYPISSSRTHLPTPYLHCSTAVLISALTPALPQADMNTFQSPTDHRGTEQGKHAALGESHCELFQRRVKHTDTGRYAKDKGGEVLSAYVVLRSRMNVLAGSRSQQEEASTGTL